MATRRSISMASYKTVPEFLDSLDDNKRIQVQTLRDIILKTDPTLAEHIKWNSPSYVLDGEDRITFSLNNKQGIVKLVLHMGATRPENKEADSIYRDESGLIAWSSDIRGVLSFENYDEIESRKETVAQIIRDWLLIK